VAQTSINQVPEATIMKQTRHKNADMLRANARAGGAMNGYHMPDVRPSVWLSLSATFT